MFDTLICFVETRANEKRQLLCHIIEHFYKKGRDIGADEERPKGVCSIRMVVRRFAPSNYADAPHPRGYTTIYLHFMLRYSWGVPQKQL